MSNLIIPDDLKLINATQSSSAIVDRESITLYPTGDNVIESGRKSIQSGRIEFKIPTHPRKSFDLSTLFIHFNFRIVLTGVTKSGAGVLTRIFVHDSIESIVKSVTVDLANSQRLEFINDYNALESALNFYCSSDYVRGFGAPVLRAGVHSHIRNRIYHKQQANTTLTAASEVTNSFSMPLRLSGVSSPDFTLPSSIFGSGGFMTITIDLEAPVNCIFAQECSALTKDTNALAGGVVTDLGGSEIYYELSNIRMTLDAITYSAEYESMVANALASSRLVYPIKTWDVQARQISGSGNGQTRYTETLSFNYSSVNAIFAWFVKSSEQSTHKFAGKDRLWFPDGLKDIQFKVNGFNVPYSRPIDCSGGCTEGYCHLLSALSVLHTCENYGGLNYDSSPVCLYGQGQAALTGGFVAADSFYGKNRQPSYGLPVDENSNTGTETTGPSLVETPLTVADAAETCNQILPYQRENSPSHFLIGVNLKKLLRSSPGEISGENLSSGSSGQVQYELNFSTANTTSYIMYIAVLHDRFISLSNQSAVVSM